MCVNVELDSKLGKWKKDPFDSETSNITNTLSQTELLLTFTASRRQCHIAVTVITIHYVNAAPVIYWTYYASVINDEMEANMLIYGAFREKGEK